MQRRRQVRRGKAETGIYLRTLIDIVTMVAIFVTSEKNRTSDYSFYTCSLLQVCNFTLAEGGAKGTGEHDTVVHSFFESTQLHR